MTTATATKTAERYVLTIGDGSGSGNPDDAGIKFVGMWNFTSLDEAIGWKKDLQAEGETVTLQVVFTDGTYRTL
jgi:hypothetical protein